MIFWVMSLAWPSMPNDTRPVLRMGLHVSDFNTIDPHRAASTSDRIPADLMYNGLIRFQPGNCREMSPDLALEIPDPVMIRGRQTWTFHLRKDVVFHPIAGKPEKKLTARDVCRSFIRAADPIRSDYAGGYEGISVVVTGPYTLRFTVDPPQSPLLFLPKVADYAGGFIVSETVDAKGRMRLRGTGPFYLPSPTDTDPPVHLKSHDAYFRGRPRLAGVDILFLPEGSRRLQALLNSRVDIIVGESDARWLAPLYHRKEILVDSFGVSETSNIYFNTAFPPFSDIRVRKAVAYAVDRTRFLPHFGKDLVQPVLSPVPPYMPGGLPPEEVMALGLDYARDLHRARQLMEAAGYGDGFEMDVVVSEVDSFYHNYTTLKQQLVPIHITMNLHLVDHATMHRLIRQDVTPLVIYEAFRPNTDEYLSRFFHSSATVASGKSPATNFSHFSGIDSLIEKARLERFTSRQIKLWEYAQVKLLEEMVVLPLLHKNQVYVRRASVDYGHPLKATMALYPQFTELTTLLSSHGSIVP